MNPEKLHEALNLLDEELIAPVENMRGRRRQWHHLGVLAACLAVVCVLSFFGIRGLKRGDAETAPENELATEAVEEADTEGESGKSAKREMDDSLDISGVDVIYEGADVILMETMLVKVTELGTDSITATVLHADRFYAEGETVVLQFTELTGIIRGKQVESALPMEDFAVGDVLTVDYSFGENREVIAECITFGER